MPELRPPVARILERARADDEIAAVFLVGSEARGEGHVRSDTDVCLVIRSGADAFEKRLEYGGEPGTDVQVFSALPLYVRVRFLREAEPLLMKDEEEWYRQALGAWRRWQDFRPFVTEYLETAGIA